MKGRHSLLLKRIVTFMITILLTFTSISVLNHLTAEAGLFTDIFGTSSSAGGNYTKNGCSDSRLGYLCYPVMAEGGAAVPGGSAKFFTAPGWNPVGGAIAKLEPRRGQYGAGSPSGAAPWNLKPFTHAGNSTVTHQAEIKQWFQADGGMQGGTFVKGAWGEQIAEKFSSGDVVIVIETVMNFQWSTTGGGASDYTSYAEAEAMVRSTYGGMTASVFIAARKDGLISEAECENILKQLKSPAGHEVAKGAYRLIVAAVQNEANRRGGSGCVLHGSPVTGTVPNLIKYKQSLGLTKTRLDSWTNQGAPDAEKILPGGPGERAGYTAITATGPHSDETLTAPTNGLAMFVISCKEDLIHTYWAANGSPGEPEPAQPNKIGKYNIYKIYHTKKYKNGVMIEDTFNDGTFHTEQCIPDISVDDEPDEYHLEYWSSDTGTGDPSSSTEVLAKHGPQNGTGPKVITLSKQDRNEQSVYVVLVKEENEEEEEDYNWLLTQSMITRTVWQNYPDEEGAGWEYLYDYDFTWESKGHLKKCYAIT